MRKWVYKPGQWNALCDVCGWKFKSAELLERWDGLMVCKKDYETRHPQDFLRVDADDAGIPWSRPQPPDNFI